MKRKAKSSTDEDEPGVPRCTQCGGLQKYCGGAEQFVALCVCQTQSVFSRAPPLRDRSFDDVLTHKGYHAHAFGFADFAAAPTKR